MTPQKYKIDVVANKVKEMVERLAEINRDGKVTITFQMQQGGIREGSVKVSVEDKI